MLSPDDIRLIAETNRTTIYKLEAYATGTFSINMDHYNHFWGVIQDTCMYSGATQK